MQQLVVGGKRISLILGDITRERVDAIVNAANSNLMGGGGVDGAIHAAGGAAILDECREIRIRRGGCPTGHAVITTAGRLPSKHVIHTVGPIWSGGVRGEPELLASCYQSSLELAVRHGLRTVAFPSISTGAYRFPIERAARIALGTIVRLLKRLDIDEVRFILFTRADFDIYAEALDEVSKELAADGAR
jgi:O-acetyl-ADP-ribose deacetylase (regulator of RNase III)